MPNCKPGDLAIFVRSKTGLNLGRIVRCIELVGVGQQTYDGEVLIFENPNAVVWRIEQPIPLRRRGGDRIIMVPFATDENLRPLRDNPGEDEILRIAGLPQITTEF